MRLFLFSMCLLGACIGKDYMWLLNVELDSQCFTEIEGHIFSSNEKLPSYFEQLLRDHPEIQTIGEIGFNAGHSSLAFLQARDDIHVYSFDIMDHEYAKVGRDLIKMICPERFRLIEGDSRITVPLFYRENPELKFDLIFIDGDHSLFSVLADIRNMNPFSHMNTILVLAGAQPGSRVDYALQTCLRREILADDELFSSSFPERHAEKAWVQCRYTRAGKVWKKPIR